MSHTTDTACAADESQPGLAREWFVDAGGRTEGPLPEAELRARAAAGRLDPAARLSADRRAWVPVAAVPWLWAGAPAGRRPARPMVDTVVAGGAAGAPADEPSAAFAALDEVPGYELNGVLGTGACGVVYRAVQTKLGRPVALKTVRMSASTPADLLTRFDLEAVALARLQHPNIVAVYDCGHTGGRAFFAMELLAGDDLSAALTRDGPLPERVAWLIARQTAAALEHAARHGVIHRDIKPANLFLVDAPTGFPLPSGVPMVKVTDFGLALTLRGPDEVDLTQTAAGVFIGTPVYMPPEQFLGPVDLRADIYGLGATVYQALAGRIPFDGRTVGEVMEQKGAPPPRLAPPISEESADLVAAMMAPDPRDRPQNYAELIARIDALPCLDGSFTAAGLPIATPNPTRAAPPAAGALEPPARARRVARIVMAAAVLAVAAAVAAGVAFWPSKPAVYAEGAREPLFDGTPVHWEGRGWSIEEDDEKAKVLEGQGRAVRPLRPWPHFRAVVRIDLYKASAAELVVARADGPPEAAAQWLVRLDRAAGAAFGTRAGPTGAFEPLLPPAPLPARNDAQRPYLRVRVERAGGVLSAWADDRLLGSVSARGLTADALQLDAQGGPVRIEAAEQTEVVERPR